MQMKPAPKRAYTGEASLVARDCAPTSSAKALNDLEGLSESFSSTMKFFEGLSLEERLVTLCLWAVFGCGYELEK
jgi:hypothetical protein